MILKSVVPNKNEKYCYYPLEERGKLYINIHHPQCREKTKDFNGSWDECINELVEVVKDWKRVENNYQIFYSKHELN